MPNMSHCQITRSTRCARHVQIIKPNPNTTTNPNPNPKTQTVTVTKEININLILCAGVVCQLISMASILINCY